MSDNIYAPPTFHGKSTEDAQEFLAYVERFAGYKHMHQGEILELLPVLLRDAASDFYDTLSPETKANWDDFKKSFLDRFGRSEAIRWKDASDLWHHAQGPTESCDDYIARMTRLAKRIPGLDEAMLRYSVITGLKSGAVKCHVLQANVQTMPELLQAARVAEMATASSTDSLSLLLTEIKNSNDKHAEHAAAFQQLTSRLGKLAVTSLDDRHRAMSRDRSPSPRRVHFEESRYRHPSPAPRGRSPVNYRPSTTYRRQQSPAPSKCQRCGLSHAYRTCPAQNARCLHCNRLGHFRAVCRQARRDRI